MAILRNIEINVRQTKSYERTYSVNEIIIIIIIGLIIIVTFFTVGNNKNFI
jgi:hypothetical protein